MERWNVPEVSNIDSLCTGIALDVVPASVGPAFDLYAALNFFVFFVSRTLISLVKET